MYITNKRTASSQLINSFIRNYKILTIQSETRSLIPPILDIILSYADMPSEPTRHKTLVEKYQKQLVKQRFLTLLEVNEFNEQLARSDNDSREYAILFEVSSGLARAFHYKQNPDFEKRIMPLLQSLPRQVARQKPAIHYPDDKWVDDQEYTFFRWVSGSGFVSILHDVLATGFYQHKKHLHAALQFGDHLALQTALRRGNTEIVEVLLQTDFYQNPENLHQALVADKHEALYAACIYGFPAITEILLSAAYYQNPENLGHILRDNNHKLLGYVCINGHTAVLALLLKTPFYQDQNNLAEALQPRAYSILWACCLVGNTVIVEMLLATEYYQSANNLHEILEAQGHSLFKQTIKLGQWDVVKIISNSDYYQNHNNLSPVLSADEHYFLRAACMAGEDAIVRMLIDSDFYQNPDNLRAALIYKDHQALGCACTVGRLDIIKILLNTTFYQNEENFSDFLSHNIHVLKKYVLPDVSLEYIKNSSSAEILQLIRQQSWFTEDVAIQDDTKEDASSTARLKRRPPSFLLFTDPQQHKRHSNTAAGQTHNIDDIGSFEFDEAESSESPRHDAAG